MFMKKENAVKWDLFGKGRNESIGFSVKLDQEIPSSIFYPSYWDKRFMRFNTIFLLDGSNAHEMYQNSTEGEMVQGLVYYYSDRLQQADPEGHQKALIEANESDHKKCSAAYVQQYLRSLLKAPNLEVVHIKVCVGPTGWPLYLYGVKSSN